MPDAGGRQKPWPIFGQLGRRIATRLSVIHRKDPSSRAASRCATPQSASHPASSQAKTLRTARIPVNIDKNPAALGFLVASPRRFARAA
jgi:hypothetical protein